MIIRPGGSHRQYLLDLAGRTKSSFSSGIPVPVLIMPTKCPDCSYEYPADSAHCLACGRPAPRKAGFPNVVLANRADERRELNNRYIMAMEEAEKEGTRDILSAFIRSVVEDGRLVTACGFPKFRQTFEREDGVFPIFQRMLEAGLIFVGDDPMNRLRLPAEEATLPRFSRDITFAALSIENRGISHYGNFLIVWNPERVDHRATLFVANCVTWRLQRGMAMDQPAPPGFRARWQDRGQLAAQKCRAEISPMTTDAEFSCILLRDSANPGDGFDVFIEGHIWGPLSRGSVSRVIRSRRDRRIGDNLTAAQIARDLHALGIGVEGFP